MSVLTKDEYLNKINALIGENTSDDALTFIEDMNDTFNDFETRLSDSTDWKTKYETNDAEWRQKYRDRFFNSVEDDLDDKVDEPNTPKTFEDLFTIN